MKKISLTLMLMVTLVTFSQQLTYKNGRILNDQNKKLSNGEVKTLLAPNSELLAKYNAGKTKSSVGGFLLGFGLGFIAADLVTGATQDKVYPSAFTYIGIASTIISIPVMLGRTKKIKSAIDGYNQSLQVNKLGFNLEKISIISNRNGIGLKVKF